MTEEEHATQYRYPWMSFTAIKTYETCPRRFKYRYVDGCEVEENVRMERGSIIHSIFENFFTDINPSEVYNMLQKEPVGKELTDRDIYKRFVTIMKARIPNDNPIFVDSEEVKMVEKNIEAFAKLEVKRLLKLNTDLGGLGKDDIKKYWFPYALEKRYADPATRTYGVLDRVNLNVDGNFTLMDYKTGGGHDAKEKLASYEKLQARIYMNMFREAEGIKDPKNVNFYFAFTNVKNGRYPNLLPLKYHRYGEECMRVKVEKYRAAIDAGMFNRPPEKWEQNGELRRALFYKRKICCSCDYTEDCWGKPRDVFTAEVNIGLRMENEKAHNKQLSMSDILPDEEPSLNDDEV